MEDIPDPSIAAQPKAGEPAGRSRLRRLGLALGKLTLAGAAGLGYGYLMGGGNSMRQYQLSMALLGVGFYALNSFLSKGKITGAVVFVSMLTGVGLREGNPNNIKPATQPTGISSSISH
jgi:hypothetical protein